MLKGSLSLEFGKLTLKFIWKKSQDKFLERVMEVTGPGLIIKHTIKLKNPTHVVLA